jgi:class 3 adenylate cyclase
VAAHNLRHLCPVRRTTGRRVDHFGTLSEELRADRRGCNDGEPLHVFGTVVVEPVNGARRMQSACPGPTSISLPSTVHVNTPSMP